MRDNQTSTGNALGLRPRETEDLRTPSEWFPITEGMTPRLTTEAEIPDPHHRIEWNGDRLIELEKQGQAEAF